MEVHSQCKRQMPRPLTASFWCGMVLSQCLGMDQPEVELVFTAQSGSLTITGPPNGNIAPAAWLLHAV